MRHLKSYKIFENSDDSVYYSEYEIPLDLIDDIKSSLSEDEWNEFINNENICIKRNLITDMRTNPFTTIDKGWALFSTLR